MAQQAGLLSSLGLQLDPEQIMREQMQQRQAQSLGMVDTLGLNSAGGRGAANIGALLGARMATPEGLTADQRNRVAATKDAEQRMSAWLRENADVSETDKAFQYQTILAESAFKNGLPDVGSTVLQSLDQERRAREMQQLQLKAAGLLPEQAEANLAQTRASTAAMGGKNKLAPVWDFGEKDPNKSRMAWIDGDGNAVLGDGQALPLGKYTTKAPEIPNVWGRGGRGAGGMTPTEAGKLRDAASALYSRGRTMNDMRGIIDEMFTTTGTPAGTAKAGQFVAWTDRWANDLGNIMSSFGAGKLTAVGRDGEEYELDSSSGRKKFAQQYDSIIKEALPPEFRKTAALANQYAALVSSLMYADARSQEAGSRQLSDADVQSAAQRVGANVNDPNTLREILLGSYSRAYDQLGFDLSQIDPAMRPGIITESALQNLRKQFQDTNTNWARPFPGMTAPASPAPSGGGPRIISVEPITK